MEFCKAIERLKSGSKITRRAWADGVYFILEDNAINSYQPTIKAYHYNEDIMISDGWLVDNKTDEMKFCDIIPFLLKGSKVKLKDWENMYVYYDDVAKGLVVFSMQKFPFHIDFNSFAAEDWIVVE